MPIIAQTRDQGEVLVDGKLLLKIVSPEPSSAMVVEVQNVRLKVVIRLSLAKILAKFGAYGNPVPLEENAGGVPLKIPPISVGKVLVFGERRDARARIVVDVNPVVIVPVVGKPA